MRTLALMGVSTVRAGKCVKSQALPRIFLAIALLASLSVGRAEENAASTGDYVSRAEYEKLKGELETLKAQIAQLMKNQTQQPPASQAERPSSKFKVVTSPQSEVSEAAIFPSRQYLVRNWQRKNSATVQRRLIVRADDKDFTC